MGSPKFNPVIENINFINRKKDKVKVRHFQANKRFIDDLGTLNDGGVFNDVYKDIYLLNYN